MFRNSPKLLVTKLNLLIIALPTVRNVWRKRYVRRAWWIAVDGVPQASVRPCVWLSTIASNFGRSRPRCSLPMLVGAVARTAGNSVCREAALRSAHIHHKYAWRTESNNMIRGQHYCRRCNEFEGKRGLCQANYGLLDKLLYCSFARH